MTNEAEFVQLVGEYGQQKANEILEERKAVERLRHCLSSLGNDLKWYWHWGDGHGGFVFEELTKVARANGYAAPQDLISSNQLKRKKKIGHALSTRVKERDEYRCKHCGTHLDLTCDHIVPESAGGETAYENLQTLCRRCNSRKGTRVEVRGEE